MHSPLKSPHIKDWHVLGMTERFSCANRSPKASLSMPSIVRSLPIASRGLPGGIPLHKALGGARKHVDTAL